MKAGIALGSNVEPRLDHLRAAHHRLCALHKDAAPCLVSRVYETSPVDCSEGTPGFLNAVVEITTSLEPHTLVERLQAIEQALGRPARHGHHTPRTIDLDLLYAGASRITTPALTVPHPRLAGRRFVLRPLADIRPELVLPGQEKTVAALLETLASDESVVEFPHGLDERTP